MQTRSQAAAREGQQQQQEQAHAALKDSRADEPDSTAGLRWSFKPSPLKSAAPEVPEFLLTTPQDGLVCWASLPEGCLLRVFELLHADKEAQEALHCAGAVCTSWWQAFVEVVLGDTAQSRPERPPLPKDEVRPAPRPTAATTCAAVCGPTKSETDGFEACSSRQRTTAAAAAPAAAAAAAAGAGAGRRDGRRHRGRSTQQEQQEQQQPRLRHAPVGLPQARSLPALPSPPVSPAAVNPAAAAAAAAAAAGGSSGLRRRSRHRQSAASDEAQQPAAAALPPRRHWPQSRHAAGSDDGGDAPGAPVQQQPARRVLRLRVPRSPASGGASGLAREEGSPRQLHAADDGAQAMDEVTQPTTAQAPSGSEGLPAAAAAAAAAGGGRSGKRKRGRQQAAARAAAAALFPGAGAAGLPHGGALLDESADAQDQQLTSPPSSSPGRQRQRRPHKRAHTYAQQQQHSDDHSGQQQQPGALPAQPADSTEAMDEGVRDGDQRADGTSQQHPQQQHHLSHWLLERGASVLRSIIPFPRRSHHG